MRKNRKAGIILLSKYADAVSEMSTEDAGLLLKAIYAYDTESRIPEMTPFAHAIFMLISADMREHAERYAEVCERNRANARKRWNSETTEAVSTPCERIPLDTAVYDAMQSHADAYEICQEEEEEEEKGKRKYVYMSSVRTDAAASAASPLAENVFPLMTRAERERFEQFWALYPRKEARARAEAAWKEISPNEELTDRILHAITTACASDPRFATTQYIPHPANWLRRREWENEYEVPKKKGEPNYGSWTTN